MLSFSVFQKMLFSFPIYRSVARWVNLLSQLHHIFHFFVSSDLRCNNRSFEGDRSRRRPTCGLTTKQLQRRWWLGSFDSLHAAPFDLRSRISRAWHAQKRETSARTNQLTVFCSQASGRGAGEPLGSGSDRLFLFSRNLFQLGPRVGRLRKYLGGRSAWTKENELFGEVTSIWRSNG